ncbi:MAG: prepilin-type N-terminal cleavage/methylation domain-containing protein [Gammaproteobacteria bacterium]|nr:prepilin-type N-terminal cleavage/methylation domain-containing protein [Gammaproteobacteria bacterium]
MAQTSNRNGFTLIEVMVALVIVAITASFALASYRRYLVRSYRLEAVQALLTAAAEQEKFHLAHGRYSDRLDATGGDDPPGLPVSSTTPQRRYEMTIELADAAAFRLAAQPAAGGGQMNDTECRRFSIDESGRRQALDSTGVDSTRRCW